jgi:hypothetical protein
MVLCADGNGIQSDSHPENSRGNGMSLSGVGNMRQKDGRSCACGAVDHPFVLLPPSQTSGNSAQNRVFQQPASACAEHEWGISFNS